jgi:hypothetical protein
MMQTGLLSEAPLPAAGEAPLVALPFRLHADAVEELLERLPPLVLPPRFDARHVHAVEPGALLSLTMLAASHGVLPPALPVPPDALVAPLQVADAMGAVALLDALSGAAFAGRLAGWGWTPADARRLSALVSELSRNAIEHAGAPAWVAAWKTGPAELRVAVADGGMGFGGSLGVRDEADAVLRALANGASRFAGRGQGLRQVGQTVAAWGGRMRVRSRTVVVRGTPPWHDAWVHDQLPLLPGVQVEVVLPSPPGRPRTPGLGSTPPSA